MNYTMSELALLLGTPQTDIWDWIDSGMLAAQRNNKFVTVNEDELIGFLLRNPEYVGRLYKHDIPGYIDKLRRQISSRLEERRGEIES